MTQGLHSVFQIVVLYKKKKKRDEVIEVIKGITLIFGAHVKTQIFTFLEHFFKKKKNLYKKSQGVGQDEPDLCFGLCDCISFFCRTLGDSPVFITFKGWRWALR